MLDIVDAEEPPLRALFGGGAVGIVTGNYECRLKTWNDWQHVALIAQGSAQRD